MKELGVTHIEVLPFHDLPEWMSCLLINLIIGAITPPFNAPEGSYSLDPQNPKCRITELKR
ncbi:hypothetical protein PO124_10005 [Bacillus licheniformis]|nr:hypothetical protein [Bacillus licheniformis]